MATRLPILALCVLLLPAAASSQAQGVSTDIVERESGEALRYAAAAGMTASGEPYNPERLTLAHASLPFGTLVEVTFRRRSITARVNDRDTGDGLVRLSARAADNLGLPPGGGYVEVRLDPGEVAFLREQAARREADSAPASTTPPASNVTETWDRYTVQLGSFSNEGRARDHASRRRGTWVQAVTLGGETVFRVYYGVYPTREAARRAMEALREDGLHGFVQGLRGDVSQGEDRHGEIGTSEPIGGMDGTSPRRVTEPLANQEPYGRPTVRGW